MCIRILVKALNGNETKKSFYVAHEWKGNNSCLIFLDNNLFVKYSSKSDEKLLCKERYLNEFMTAVSIKKYTKSSR